MIQVNLFESLKYLNCTCRTVASDQEAGGSSLLKCLFYALTVSSGYVKVVKVGKFSFLHSQVKVKGHGKKCDLKMSKSFSLPFSIPHYTLHFPILLTFHMQ